MNEYLFRVLADPTNKVSRLFHVSSIFRHINGSHAALKRYGNQRSHWVQVDSENVCLACLIVSLDTFIEGQMIVHIGILAPCLTKP
jgi:hypothetical protein